MRKGADTGAVDEEPEGVPLDRENRDVGAALRTALPARYARRVQREEPFAETVYPVDETARKHGVGVDEETTSGAYEGMTFEDGRYREGLS